MELCFYNYKEKRESQKYIEKLCNEYIANHIREQERDELITENNIEKRDIKGYHGREILELLQNADDAYQKSIDMGEKPECELELLIEYKNNILTVSNTGTFFDKEGIKAIVQGNNSPKSGKYIGNKGTGFRSILNWADKVKIYSGDFNIEFSKEIAAAKLREIKNEKQIQRQMLKQSDLYIPMLAVPANIEGNGNKDRTTIEITINPKKSNDDYGVSKQIENIDLRILLFLPNIRKIEIVTEDMQIIYERTRSETELKYITLQKLVNNEIKTKEQFYLYNKTIEKAIEEDNTKKDIRLAIAVPRNFDSFQSGYLYSFFPLLDTESPFNCVMHASYALGDHRDTINRDAVNKRIVIEQLYFLIEIANQFIECQQHNIALSLLTPINFTGKNWKFFSAFSKFEVEEVYLNLIEKVKMLLTVNDEYISVEGNPKMFDCDFPHFFTGSEFSTLLKPVLNEKAILLIQTISNRLSKNLKITESELLPIINNLTNIWKPSQQIEVFDWWNRNYKESLPKLLKTQTGKWLEYGEECYFLVGDFTNKGLPSWVKVPSLDDEYQELLFRHAETSEEIQKVRENDKVTHISRLISQKNVYPLVKFAYRDRSNIISTVNSSVDSYNKSIDFVNWLWSNYREESEDWTPPGRSDNFSFKYKFPSADEKAVKNSENLYFGSDYGNDLSEKLFDGNYNAFPNLETFSVNKKDLDIFQEFIAKFGVKKFPIIEKQKVYPLDSYQVEYDKIIKLNGDIGSSSYIYITYNIPFIKQLEDKLKELTTAEIVKWIYEDYTLNSYLSSPYYSENAEISYYGNLQKLSRKYYGKVRNYILAVFNEIKWLEIDGKRYSPKQILKDINSRNNQKFSELLPVINTEFLKDIAQCLKIDYIEVLKIMELFDFCDRVTDLNSDDFYGLMLQLPEYDFQKSVELSKMIYRIIEQANFTKNYEASENKNKFFKSGNVLVQYQGKLQYYASKESYLPSTKIISKQNVPIVEKGQRTNTDNFVRIFGCQQYNKEYSIKKETISEGKSNPVFQHYFSEFLKYARAYSERNENFERDIGKLSIILVDKITIIENDQVVKITDEYVCIRESATSWYITVLGNEYGINQISEAIENICANIANTPGFESGKLGELFRAKEKADREFLIKKEFGSLDVIADESYKNEIRNNFIETIQKTNKNYPIDEIDIDFENFSSEQNSEKLIKLLLDIETDIDQFKKAGFVFTINLIPHYKVKLMNFINNEKRRFKNSLYNKAVKDESLQGSFLENVRRFENFEIEKYENSIYFDVETFVRGFFGNWNNDEFEGNKLLDSNTEYSKNYELLNLDRLFEDEISNNSNVQQMIYFNKAKKFETWLDAQKNAQQSNTNKPADIYSKYKGVIPQKEEAVFRDPGSMESPSKPRSNGTYTQGSAERRNRNQKVFGNKGELVIYNLLCEQFGEENVFPKSEAFVEVGILKPGQASSGKYDLSYKDESGTEFFVEVKTGDGKSFMISPGELEFAKQNPNQFKLFLVYEIDSETPKYIELPVKFWEDKKFRKTEIVERIEFKF
ncbi:hypothetical protein Curi_c04390 [Gottschalkia acidurici 9a]|uniref:Protein NO VEIN C-terminal domain-containing protein n=1 Tax=Gottschalkia acidurici (strain ATCC 7906 / DSM 604 / BCRC 14475 / CIP 104303 / KCTC 5404 / NCIMB 10678 / 9a) TaxID=1128398 RepID=K0AWB6_GOTA9|nr:DUF3883 domain-containing protein [Gottschalkia acidurici]AFS77514.1 hypothetical protein Curi_c04390 [Gottschalkia acidurici 9a]